MLYPLSADTFTLNDVTSLREWLASWGGGPNWSDASGITVPTSKDVLTVLLDIAERHLSQPKVAVPLTTVTINGKPVESPEPVDLACG